MKQESQEENHERPGQRERQYKVGKDHEGEKERFRLLQSHHKETIWVHWLLIFLGVWMILAPLTFSYGTLTVEPAGGRSVWLSLNGRILAMTWSDILCGVLLILFGWRSLTPNRPVSLWACCFIGIWLNLAPILFWAPNAAAYINGTLVGIMAISLSVIIPGIPNHILFKKHGSGMPGGWSYNPSSLSQRSFLFFFAAIGWMASRYLGAYQLGYLETAWDPFFGDSTRQVLESDLSETWPVSDGALGGFAYTLEFLMIWLGGTARWRTMPWMVAFFGILVVPLGLVHILLIISQPVIVGAWCTLCLLGAAVALPLIALTIDEVAAAVQHLVLAKQKGYNVWEVFWKGAEPEESRRDDRSPDIQTFPEKPGRVLRASLWGASFPLTLVFCILLGIWLMFAPNAFGVTIEATSANINHLAGSLIIVVSAISMAEVIRKVRYVNILLGLVVATVPWFLPDGGQMFYLNGTFAGVFVILLSIPGGAIKESYGFWDSYVR